MPGNVSRSDLTRWARRSLARLRNGRGRHYGRFRVSRQLTAREQRLLRGWIDALDAHFRARLPRVKVVPAQSILRYGTKILLDADSVRKGVLPADGDRSTQAVSYVRQRVLVLHRRLFRQRWLGQRLFYHELGHFLWPRLGTRARRRFITHLRRELTAGVRGELGYTAQFRKARLIAKRDSGNVKRQAGAVALHGSRTCPERSGSNPAHHPERKSRGRRVTVHESQAWREYVCESFCDTGAYALAQAAGTGRHLRSVEFTLTPRHRAARVAAWQRALAR